MTVDVEPTTGDLDGAGPRAVRRVAAQEVGERLRWRQVVDGDDLDRRLGGTACPVRRDPHQIPPDSAHPVDAHSYAHVLALPRLSLLTSWMRLRCSSHGRSAFPVGQRTLREGSPPSSVRWHRTDGRAQQHDSFQVACADHPDDPLGVGDEDQVSARGRGSLEQARPTRDRRP